MFLTLVISTSPHHQYADSFHLLFSMLNVLMMLFLISTETTALRYCTNHGNIIYKKSISLFFSLLLLLPIPTASMKISSLVDPQSLEFLLFLFTLLLLKGSDHYLVLYSHYPTFLFLHLSNLILSKFYFFHSTLFSWISLHT